MKNLKKYLLILLALTMLFSAACRKAAEKEEPSASAEETQQADETDSTQDEQKSKTLVAYFSATGTTKNVAEMIADITDADIYEIVPKEKYSSADLNYNDSSSRSTKEQRDKSFRTVIGSDDIDISEYDTVYIGFPIWHGEEPRIIDTFVEKYDFTGKTVIPFCTSASSGIGNSGDNMKTLAGGGNWIQGKRFPGSVTKDTLSEWIESLN